MLSQPYQRVRVYADAGRLVGINSPNTILHTLGYIYDSGPKPPSHTNQKGIHITFTRDDMCRLT